jgi:hypothetical protein
MEVDVQEPTRLPNGDDRAALTASPPPPAAAAVPMVGGLDTPGVGDVVKRKRGRPKLSGEDSPPPAAPAAGASEEVEALRRRAIDKKQTLLTAALARREREIAQLVALSIPGMNVHDISLHSPEFKAALEQYVEAHKPGVASPGAPEAAGSQLSAPARQQRSPLTQSADVPPASPAASEQKRPEKIKITINRRALVATATPVPVTPEPAAPAPFALPLKKQPVEDPAIRAEREQQVLKRVQELQAQGLWSPSRLLKLPEPSRSDYLLLCPRSPRGSCLWQEQDALGLCAGGDAMVGQRCQGGAQVEGHQCEEARSRRLAASSRGSFTGAPRDMHLSNSQVAGAEGHSRRRGQSQADCKPPCTRGEALVGQHRSDSAVQSEGEGRRGEEGGARPTAGSPRGRDGAFLQSHRTELPSRHRAGPSSSCACSTCSTCPCSRR